jgi:hypothetical protein
MLPLPIFNLVARLSPTPNSYRPSRIADRAARGVFSEPQGITKELTVTKKWVLSNDRHKIEAGTYPDVIWLWNKGYAELISIRRQDIDELIDLLTLAKNMPESDTVNERIVV